MIFAALLLAACETNLNEHPFWRGGTRHATGESGRDSGGGSDSGDTADTGISEDAPEITDVYGEILDPQDDVDGVYYGIVAIVVADPQGDLVGGRVFFDVIDPDGGTTSESRSIVDIDDADGAEDTSAGLDAGTLMLRFGPVEEDKAYFVDAIVVRDAAGHNSAPSAVEIRSLATD